MTRRVTTRSPRPEGDPSGGPAGSTEALRREVGGLARGGLLNLGSSAASQLAMLVLTIVLLGLLLASAAFLSGVYGAFGKAAASGVLAGAALVVELVAILPALQVKYLLTRAGRRAFGLPALWRKPAVAA